MTKFAVDIDKPPQVMSGYPDRKLYVWEHKLEYYTRLSPNTYLVAWLELKVAHMKTMQLLTGE